MALTRLEEFDTGKVVRILEPWLSGQDVIQEFGNELFGYVNQEPNLGPRGDLCIDFSGLKNISSTGIGKIIELSKKLREKKQDDLACANVPEEIKFLIEYKHLYKIFRVYPTVEDYLGRYGG
jgi:hypothetical protein